VSAYNVQAVKWGHGWELHVEDVGVTQCRTLATAAQQACDFVATMLDIDADGAEVHLSVAIGGVEKDVERARKMTAEAVDKQHQAAAESRRVVRELRHAGLSVADTAAVMDISKGARLPTHQRLNPPRPATSSGEVREHQRKISGQRGEAALTAVQPTTCISPVGAGKVDITRQVVQFCTVAGMAAVMAALAVEDELTPLRVLVDEVLSTRRRTEITRHGRRAAVLLSAADFDQLQERIAALTDPTAPLPGAAAPLTLDQLTLDQLVEVARRAGLLG